MAVDSTGDDGGWQVGVPASAEAGPAGEQPDDGQEPAGMDTSDIAVARHGKALKVQGASM